MRAELVHELLRRTAERHPDARAVVDGDETLDYRTLEEQSNRLARLLIAAGCRPGDRVAVLAPKAPRTLVALVGAMKAGALFVPLDPGSPAPRQVRILRSADCRCLLAAPSQTGRVGELQAASGALPRLVSLGARAELAGATFAAPFGWEDLAFASPAPPVVRFETDPAAEILYTSGSTGEPKGVVVRHQSIVRFVEWALDHFGITRGERLSSHSPLHFDLSTFDLFGAFASGAELHLVPPGLNLVPQQLVDWMAGHELTQWFSVPSVLAYAAGFDALSGRELPALRRLLWCGEVFPLPALRYWMRKLPRVAFANLYGPTEATIASSYHDVAEPPADDLDSLPIGVACDGEELLVLDEALQPVPEGRVGELYLRGAGLARGYWRDPQRTEAAFLEDPAGGGRIYRTGDLARRDERGLVHLLGRIDSQIKSRGYRIELGEIESALAATGLVREAVVTSVPSGGFEGQQICCAYAPVDGASPLEVRGALARLLPGYMLPARWTALERLPRNGSGKLDRRAVRDGFSATPRHGTASTRASARV